MKLRDLLEYVDSLPIGAVVDEALKAGLVERVRSIGSGEPLRARGSGYDELGLELFGDGAAGDQAGFYPAPAGPPGPAPGPPPRAVPDDEPEPPPTVRGRR